MAIQCLDSLGNKIKDGYILEFNNTSQYIIKEINGKLIMHCLSKDLPHIILSHICVNNKLASGRIIEKTNNIK